MTFLRKVAQVLICKKKDYSTTSFWKASPYLEGERFSFLFHKLSISSYSFILKLFFPAIKTNSSFEIKVV